MKDLFSLEGKIALVTGGSVGIGAMIAEGFVNFGAKVYIVARREEVLRKKQEELANIGPCEYIAADVGSVAGIKELAKAYGEREQSLDILVNNAGISDGGREIEELTEDTWDAVMDLNLKTIFFMTQAFLPFLRVGASPETPRNVINIASIDGCGASTGRSPGSRWPSTRPGSPPSSTRSSVTGSSVSAITGASSVGVGDGNGVSVGALVGPGVKVGTGVAVGSASVTAVGSSSSASQIPSESLASSVASLGQASQDRKSVV